MSDTPLPLFDLLVSRKERDKGVTRVSKSSGNRFIEMGLEEIKKMEGTFTGEDIRRHLGRLGIVGSSPNSTGALVLTALRRNIIEATGTYVQMTLSSSHARKTPTYVLTAQWRKQ